MKPPIEFEHRGHTHHRCPDCGDTFCGQDVMYWYHDCPMEDMKDTEAIITRLSEIPSKLIIGFPDRFTVDDFKGIKDFVGSQLFLDAEYLVLDDKYKIIVEKVD